MGKRVLEKIFRSLIMLSVSLVMLSMAFFSGARSLYATGTATSEFSTAACTVFPKCAGTCKKPGGGYLGSGCGVSIAGKACACFT